MNNNLDKDNKEIVFPLDLKINSLEVKLDDLDISKFIKSSIIESEIDTSNNRRKLVITIDKEELLKSILNVNKQTTFDGYSFGDYIKYFDYLDARFIPFIPLYLIELISLDYKDTSALENFRIKYNVDFGNWNECLDIKKAYENEKENLIKNPAGCSGCSIGSLNRKYLKKLLPYLLSQDELQFIYSLYIMFNYAETLTEDQRKQLIYYKELFELSNSMVNEFIEKAKSKDDKTCSSCEANKIKQKYLEMAKVIYKSNKWTKN
jgi:hypothetical protein